MTAEKILTYLNENNWRDFDPRTFDPSLKDKKEVLHLVSHWVSSKLAEALKNLPIEGSPQDRLFEVVMLRLDVMAPYKKAFNSIYTHLRDIPDLLPESVCVILVAAQEILRLAGYSDFSTRGIAFAPIYGLTLSTWYQDETPDQAKTMAALDRYLNGMGQLVIDF